MINTMLAIFIFWINAFWATEKPKNQYEVYIFLSEQCPISQFYTLELKNIYAQYACDSIHFTAFFPVKTSNKQTIAAFTKLYELPFATKKDYSQRQAKKLGASVVPQVFVLHKNTLLYSGKIDNAYERVGKRRSIITMHYLGAALAGIVRQQPIEVTKTEPIGCIFR